MSTTETQSAPVSTEPECVEPNEKQRIVYDERMEQFETWLLQEGKDPIKYEGYAEQTVSNDLVRLNQFFVWVWNQEGEFTFDPSTEVADEYIKDLARNHILKNNGEPYAESSKRKMANTVEKLFLWKVEGDADEAWKSPVTFENDSHNPPYFFDRKERQSLREAVLEYKTIPAYSDLTPQGRDRWRIQLAQRTGTKKTEITPEYWVKYNTSFEIPTLIYVALDAGLRPCEVEKASTKWLQLDKNAMHIPKEDSSKNEDNWTIYLKDTTVGLLKRWLSEREARSKYDGTDALWLNREGNPFNSRTLNPLLRNLCEEAGIPLENRKIVWYSIRHSTGTYLASETADLKQVMLQLRHKTLEATLRYIHSDPEARKRSVENLK
ncbi:tyrosine-type recombinase/integrase [Natrialbaceae archaeon A-CW1-1]